MYGVRVSREKDSGFKRTGALRYYKLLNKMGVELAYNPADYRLMGRHAIEALKEFKEASPVSAICSLA